MPTPPSRHQLGQMEIGDCTCACWSKPRPASVFCRCRHGVQFQEPPFLAAVVTYQHSMHDAKLSSAGERLLFALFILKIRVCSPMALLYPSSERCQSRLLTSFPSECAYQLRVMSSRFKTETGHLILWSTSKWARHVIVQANAAQLCQALQAPSPLSARFAAT